MKRSELTAEERDTLRRYEAWRNVKLDIAAMSNEHVEELLRELEAEAICGFRPKCLPPLKYAGK